jgi:arsenate reductase
VIRVLFLCTANSARSQMADALLRRRAGDTFDVESAGLVARVVHPLTVRALGEVGIDWTAAESTPMSAVLDRSFDVVVTVCDEAREACPVFAGASRMVHWSFDDPAAAVGTDQQRLAAFRRVRDEIDARIQSALAACELVGGAGSITTREP